MGWSTLYVIRNAVRRCSPHAKQRGQSIVIVALVLPLLLAMVLVGIEVASRQSRLAEIQDATRAATRTSVQLLDYQSLAQNKVQGDPEEVRRVAVQTFRANMQSFVGLKEPLDELVNEFDTNLQIYPDGGTCTFESRSSTTFTTPAVCNTIHPRLNGLVPIQGWETWTATVDASETLDPIRK